MSKRNPPPEGRRPAQGPYSPVVVDGDHVFTADQVGFDEQGDLVEGGIEAQARRTLENLAACLQAAGCGLGDVLKVTPSRRPRPLRGEQHGLREFFTTRTPPDIRRRCGCPGGCSSRSRPSHAYLRRPRRQTPPRRRRTRRAERNSTAGRSTATRSRARQPAHIKTHKCVEIARRQVELGADGLTCQTLGEAELMAEAARRSPAGDERRGRAQVGRLAGLLEDRASVTAVADRPFRPAARWSALRPGVSCACSSSATPASGAQALPTPGGRRRARGADRAPRFAPFRGLRGIRRARRGTSSRRAADQAARRASGWRLLISTGGTPTMWEAGRLRPTVTEYRIGTATSSTTA